MILPPKVKKHIIQPNILQTIGGVCSSVNTVVRLYLADFS